MADITFTFPGTRLVELRDNICAVYGFDGTAQEKEDFARAKIIRHLKALDRSMATRAETMTFESGYTEPDVT